MKGEIGCPARKCLRLRNETTQITQDVPENDIQKDIHTKG